MLEGESKKWWKRFLRGRFFGREVSTISWEDVQEFSHWFIPYSAKRKMPGKFLRLKKKSFHSSIMKKSFHTEHSTLGILSLRKKKDATIFKRDLETPVTIL
ncbi:hypothetical protein KSP40_PGU006372 [Platanthera guangdongensis]|uniref:Uncharacterized protein n=1 Tax=Platanthera guangdongensis TaxID=2320717 RepID=A0ABR2MFB4_9ASPA